MRITYTHKSTQLTIERLGGIDEQESFELLGRIEKGDESLNITVVDDLGGVFVGTIAEYNKPIEEPEIAVNPRDN